jgi:hypothetical protein
MKIKISSTYTYLCMPQINSVDQPFKKTQVDLSTFPEYMLTTKIKN